MYSLKVYYPNLRAPRAVVTLLRSADVTRWLSDLLADHPGCERIVGHAGTTFLFAVDARGELITDHPVPMTSDNHTAA